MRVVAEQVVSQTSSVCGSQLSPVLVPGSQVGVPPSVPPSVVDGHITVAQRNCPLAGHAHSSRSPRALHVPWHVSPVVHCSIARHIGAPPPAPPLPPRPAVP